MKPLVTIITATSNIIENDRKDTFVQMIESVREQTYSEIEHIIIDNDSKDGTIDLLKDKNLTFYSEPDRGIFDAFNKGVKHANGKYIVFLNSDDYYHDKYGIEKAVELLEETDAGFCFSECDFILDGVTYQWEPNIYTAFRQMPFCHQTMVCKKSLLEKFQFDSSYKFIADYKLLLEFMLNRIPYAELKYNFVTFRFGGESTKDILNVAKSIDESRRIYKEIFKDLYEMSDTEVEIAINAASFPVALEKILMKYFDNESLYIDAFYEVHASRTNTIPDNNLTQEILSRKTEENSSEIDAFLEKFKAILSFVYRLLYKNLNKADKILFVDFLLKRFANIDTITSKEQIFFDKVFDMTYQLYQARENENTPVKVQIESKTANLLSKTPIFGSKPEKEQELMSYYEYVHTYVLREYHLKDFEPTNGQTILDCGASIGDTAIYFKLMYPDSFIYAFECDDENYEYLNANMELNNFENVATIKAFLSDTNDDNQLTIDEFVKQTNTENIGLIKFDIEGEERKALKGAINTIRTQKPILIIPIYHLADDCYQIPKFLKSLNMPMQFRLKWVEKRVWGMDCTLFVKFL